MPLRKMQTWKFPLTAGSFGGAETSWTVTSGGANVKGNAALKVRAYTNLYPYQVIAALLSDGTRWIQMGCVWKSLDEWERIGIRKSNLSEFPDDGSEGREECVAAFEFAKAAVLRMKLDAPKE